MYFIEMDYFYGESKQTINKETSYHVDYETLDYISDHHDSVVFKTILADEHNTNSIVYTFTLTSPDKELSSYGLNNRDKYNFFNSLYGVPIYVSHPEGDNIFGFVDKEKELIEIYNEKLSKDPMDIDDEEIMDVIYNEEYEGILCDLIKFKMLMLIKRDKINYTDLGELYNIIKQEEDEPRKTLYVLMFDLINRDMIKYWKGLYKDFSKNISGVSSTYFE